MSKFMLKYQDTEWDLDNPSLTITHEFVSSGIDVVLEHIENFLRSAGYAVDGKLEFVSVDDEGEVNSTDDDIFGLSGDTTISGIDELKVDWPYGETIKIEPINSLQPELTSGLDNMNSTSSSSTQKEELITIKKVPNPYEEPIHFRV